MKKVLKISLTCLLALLLLFLAYLPAAIMKTNKEDKQIAQLRENMILQCEESELGQIKWPCHDSMHKYAPFCEQFVKCIISETPKSVLLSDNFRDLSRPAEKCGQYMKVFYAANAQKCNSNKRL